MYEIIRKLKKINKNQSKDWTDELIDVNRKMKDAINLGAVRSNLEFDIMHREFKKIYSNLPESVDAEFLWIYLIITCLFKMSPSLNAYSKS